MVGLRPESLPSAAHSAEIAFFIRIFGSFDQIMKQPTPFLIFFSIP